MEKTTRKFILAVIAEFFSLETKLFSVTENNLSIEETPVITFHWQGDESTAVFTEDTCETKLNVNLYTQSDAFEYMLKWLLNHHIIGDLTEIIAVTNKTLHCGKEYSSTTLLNEKVMEDFEAFISLAPLNNSPAYQTAMTAMQNLPDAQHFFEADCGFHRGRPSYDRIFAIPHKFSSQFHRYGLNGISCEHVTRKVASYLNKKVSNTHLIICNLGLYSSVTAVKHGNSLYTTTGYTPNSGLPFGTGCGEIEPYVYFKLLEEFGGDVYELNELLTYSSGIRGISGSCTNIGELLSIHYPNNWENLAIDKFCWEMRKAIGSAFFLMYAQVDAIIFTGKFGENNKEIARMCMSGLDNIGIILSKNPSELTTKDSKIEVLQIKSDEEYFMASKALEAL